MLFGRGAHLAIVDDPIKNAEEAFSETTRRRTYEWFQSTLYTRLEPGGSLIIVMTRWHEDDLAGQLLRAAPDVWQEIRIPAICEDESDPLMRKISSGLCPERYDLSKLREIEKSVGSLVWNALYQQRPSALEGHIFKRSWFKFYEEPPTEYSVKIQSWDLSFKDSKNSDFVIGQVWIKVGPNFYLIEQIRARLNFPDTVMAIRSLTEKHHDCAAILIEDKANGPAVIDTLKQEITGLIAISPDGSKEARASAISSFFEAGNVFLPSKLKHLWVLEYCEEFANFPMGKHDDQVDATSQALRRICDFGIHQILTVRSAEFWS